MPPSLEKHIPELAANIVKWLAALVVAAGVFKGVLDDRYVRREDFVRIDGRLDLIQWQLSRIDKLNTQPVDTSRRNY